MQFSTITGALLIAAAQSVLAAPVPNNQLGQVSVQGGLQTAGNSVASSGSFQGINLGPDGASANGGTTTNVQGTGIAFGTNSGNAFSQNGQDHAVDQGFSNTSTLSGAPVTSAGSLSSATGNHADSHQVSTATGGTQFGFSNTQTGSGTTVNGGHLNQDVGNFNQNFGFGTSNGQAVASGSTTAFGETLQGQTNVSGGVANGGQNAGTGHCDGFSDPTANCNVQFTGAGNGGIQGGATAALSNNWGAVAGVPQGQ